MIINITNLDQAGLLTDNKPHTLAPNALSDVLNVRFRDGSIERVLGYENMQTMDGQAVYVMPYEYAGAAYWVIATSRRLYSWNGTTVTDITNTNGVLYGDISNIFTGGVFNGIAVLNNGVDIPQIWTPDVANATDMDNWPSTWKAKSIRPFRDFLIALNMTEDGINYPTKFRWSNVADPGTVPTEWIATSTNSAGDDVITETQGEIIDAEPLRQDLIIYKSDSAYFMSYVGGQFIMANRPMLKSRGILTQRCAKEFQIGQHFVVDRGDIYVHDGQNSQSILKGRAYDKFFPSMDQTTYLRSYVTRNWKDEEVWFCFPETGEQWPNLAAIWNWRNNTWSVRDLPDSMHTAWGIYPSTESQFNPTIRSLLSTKVDESGLYPATTLYPGTALYPDDGESSILAMESSYQAAGSDMTCTIERQGLKPAKSDGVWHCRAVYPHASGGDLSIEVGSQDSPNDTPTYEGPYTFTPEGTQEKVDCRVTGRYLAYKITFPADEAGEISSIDFDVVQAGTR